MPSGDISGWLTTAPVNPIGTGAPPATGAFTSAPDGSTQDAVTPSRVMPAVRPSGAS